MVVDIVNAVIVVDAAVGLDAVFRPQAVLNDKQRFLIAVIQHVEQIAQPHRVNLPAPFRACQMRVRHHVEDIGPGGLVLRLVGGDTAAHVVAE
ncbi:hypothetical protein D3C80_1952750 [compost metagenome]